MLEDWVRVSISHVLGCIWTLLLDFQNISDTLEISLGTLVLSSIMTFVCNFLVHNHIKDWEEDSNLWHNLLHKNTMYFTSIAYHSKYTNSKISSNHARFIRHTNFKTFKEFHTNQILVSGA
jgi:hypothetical protein